MHRWTVFIRFMNSLEETFKTPLRTLGWSPVGSRYMVGSRRCREMGKVRLGANSRMFLLCSSSFVDIIFEYWWIFSTLRKEKERRWGHEQDFTFFASPHRLAPHSFSPHFPSLWEWALKLSSESFSSNFSEPSRDGKVTGDRLQTLDGCVSPEQLAIMQKIWPTWQTSAPIE